MGSSKLGVQARTSFEEADAGKAQIMISAISLIETVYLVEKGSIPPDSFRSLLRHLRESWTYKVVAVGTRVAKAAIRISRRVVPDMPDRIIAATALAYNIPLITKDERLRSCAGIRTVW